MVKVERAVSFSRACGTCKKKFLTILLPTEDHVFRTDGFAPDHGSFPTSARIGRIRAGAEVWDEALQSAGILASE